MHPWCKEDRCSTELQYGRNGCRHEFRCDELEPPQISYAAPVQYAALAVTFSLHLVLAAPALVMEDFAPASVVSCLVRALAVYTAPPPVVGHISPALAVSFVL